MSGNILIIEDNEDILANLYAYLEPLGYDLDCARNGKHGLDLAVSGQFDCIILDILLPGIDGISLCKKLRGQYGSSLPIIMLTALDGEAEKVAGLDAGADDYLVKPFSLKELEARIRAILRRGKIGPQSGKPQSAQYVYADLIINPAEHTAARNGRPLRLAPVPFHILEILTRSAPEIVRRETLEDLLWGDNIPGPGALRTHIHELRKELDKPFSKPLLQTIPHVGYRLFDQSEA